jgi:hypothetical protein
MGRQIIYHVIREGVGLQNSVLNKIKNNLINMVRTCPNNGGQQMPQTTAEADATKKEES